MAVAACDGDDGGNDVESRTILWNATSQPGDATLFIVREASQFEEVRRRVPDKANLFDWPSVDFQRTVLIVYIDGVTDAQLAREGIYIHEVALEDGELQLTVEPMDDGVADDDDVQWWDVQAIALDVSDLPAGRKVRVVTPAGDTLASR